jgi:predicted extracellular nuclease
MLRQTVSTSGVVTAAGEHGLWVQSRQPDTDPATSDGVFVRCQPELIGDLAVGDAVTVVGDVREWYNGSNTANLSVTTILASSLSKSGTAPLPTPVEIGGENPIPAALPAAIVFWEKLEGMRVSVHPAFVIGPTNKYDEFVIATTAPDGERGAQASADDGPSTDRVIVEPEWRQKPPQVDVGARFQAPVVGVVDYDWGMYRIIGAPTSEAAKSKVADETSLLSGGPNALTIATLNVQNLHAGVAAARIDRLAEIIGDRMHTPDIIALQEVQDNSGPVDDGTVAGDESVARLLEALNGAYRYTEIPPANLQDGGQPGGNIRNAFLWNPERIDLMTDGQRAAFRLNGPVFANTRKPMAATFRFGTHEVIIVNIHLPSRRGDDPFYGSRQPPQTPSAARREAAAAHIGRVTDTLYAKYPDALVAIVGDMNDYAGSVTLNQLTGESLINLTPRVPRPERYTYIYQGSAQVLDHMLIGRRHAGKAEIDIVHVNADYSENRRASDHEPVLMRVSF